MDRSLQVRSSFRCALVQDGALGRCAASHSVKFLRLEYRVHSSEPCRLAKAAPLAAQSACGPLSRESPCSPLRTCRQFGSAEC